MYRQGTDGEKCRERSFGAGNGEGGDRSLKAARDLESGPEGKEWSEGTKRGQEGGMNKHRHKRKRRKMKKASSMLSVSSSRSSKPIHMHSGETWTIWDSLGSRLSGTTIGSKGLNARSVWY